MRRDPVLAAIIKRYGACGLAAAQRADHFSALLRAIVFQQLSTKAASTIYGRLVVLLPGDSRVPTAETLAALSDEQMRAAGISRQKAGYIRDLCGKVSSGAVPLDALETMTDEEVAAALTKIKGIGRWSADMFLMFRLHRPDVFPIGDLGIVNAVKKVYGMRKPTPERLRRLGDGWKPYRSVASWYLWRSLGSAPGQEAVKPSASAKATTVRRSFSEGGSRRARAGGGGAPRALSSARGPSEARPASAKATAVRRSFSEGGSRRARASGGGPPSLGDEYGPSSGERGQSLGGGPAPRALKKEKRAR
jgi:DNA-3-methyladenine glycosylase II